MNEAQVEAIMSRIPNVLVSAGAGSGKTTVLTERYFHLLEEMIDYPALRVDEILTLTFTRKAAQEMRERIARKLENENRVHERRELARAPIGTIHAFCERVLREHALEAGIDPNFRLLDEAEAHTMQENALDTVFEDLWAGTQQQRKEIGQLLLLYSQRALRGGLMSIFRAARTRGMAMDELAPIPPAPTASHVSELSTAMDSLLALDGTPKWRANLALAAETFKALQPALFSERDFSWDNYDAVRNAASGPLTPSGGPAITAKAARDAIKAAALAWQAAYLDRAAQPFLTAFILLLTRFDARYHALKETQGLLDFEDLLLRTRALLCREDAGSAEYLKTKYRQIMVDEFQDTNPLQFSIIQALQGSGHLFMVGDVKQAIYRFIGSDIRVFLAQEQRILGRDEDGLRLPMHTNYRTRPQVLQPLNALFARLWPPGAFDDGFTFEPLSAGGVFIPKKSPAIEMAFWPMEDGNAAARRDHEAQWIARRILQLTGQCDMPALQVTAKSDDAAAPPLARPAAFGDVLLLFRASTDIALYEDALRRAGIPYYVVSGRGFYNEREVQDLLHMLRVLENPMDDFSLAVVLRSPLVGVRDDTLYWLTRDWQSWIEGTPFPTETRATPSYGRLWTNIEQLASLAPLDVGDRQALQRLRELVADLQQQSLDGQPLELIDTILDRTDYLTVLLAMDGGDQRAANVQKLREVAAKFQARGIFDVTDFQRYLTQLSTQAPREASAPLDVEGSNVVRLMTIHAAKGLEAPIVLLADGGREPNNVSDEFLLSPDGLSCRMPTPEDEMARPAAYLAAAEQITRDDRREAERLLYVALTRAREHLICCGYTRYPAGDACASYADMLASMLELSEPVAEDIDLPVTFGESTFPVRIWSPDSLRATEQYAAPPQPPTLWEEYAEQIQTGRELPLLTDAGDVERYATLFDRLLPLSGTRRAAPLRIGVHRALCYHACPRQYWFRYVLNVDNYPRALADEQELPAPEDDNEARLDGTEFGKTLHAVMQRVDFTHSLPEQLPAILSELSGGSGMAVPAMKPPSADINSIVKTPDSTNIADPSRNTTCEIPFPFSALDISRLEHCLTAFAQLPLFLTLGQATSLQRELRFLLCEHGVLAPGIIDLLARTAEGWWIIDYKTGKPSADHLRQLALYALGVQRALGESPARVMLVYLNQDVAATVRNEPVTPALLDEARRLIREAAEGIRAANFHPIAGRHCANCSCSAACPEESRSQQI